MKIITLSDVHTYYDEVEVPDGDVLVLAGDMTATGTAEQIDKLNVWLGTLPHKYKLLVAGNHDHGFQKKPYKSRMRITNAVYLEDSEITIGGIHFYGSPWQPWFMDWAFNAPRGEVLARKWVRIPDYTDVLITHGPPQGILDSNIHPDDTRVNFGCADLLKRVNEVKPTYHIFGHIHGSYGQQVEEDTTFVNTSICTENYDPTNKPWVLEI